MPCIGGNRIGVALGVSAAAVVGCCIYLDYKRRSAPGYRDRIRQRKRENAKHAATDDFSELNLRSPQEIQQFFLQQMHKGEALLEEGKLDEGAMCLAYALAVTDMPQAILQVLQQTLPAEQFAMICSKLPIAHQRIMQLRGPVDNFGNPDELEENSEIVLETAGHKPIQELQDDDELE